jgi:hypothetical protein
MASFGSFVRTGWLAAALTGLTTVPAGATYTVSGHGSQGKARWTEERVVIIADASLNAIAPQAAAALERAAQTWQAALAEGPVLEVVRGRPNWRSSEAGNTVRFAFYGEPEAKGALAITRVTCNDQGEIVDADIILNGIYQFREIEAGTSPAVPSATGPEPCSLFGPWSPGHDGALSWDLQSILTHELGHFLGLGEDYVNADATMYAYSLPGDVSKRDLASADADALESVYPAAIPSEQTTGCAGASVSGRGGNRGGWLALLGALSAIALQRSWSGNAGGRRLQGPVTSGGSRGGFARGTRASK